MNADDTETCPGCAQYKMNCDCLERERDEWKKANFENCVHRDKISAEKEQMETYIAQLRSHNAGLAAESCTQQEALREARVALAACFPYDDERLALKKAALAKIDAALDSK